MKNFTIGFMLLVIGAVAGFSQDLVLKYGELVVNNDSIWLSGTKTTELIEVKLTVTNNRSTAVSLKLRKTEIQLVEGTESSFCWGECYTPFVTVSPRAITIQSMFCDRNSFVGDYRPFGIEGTSIVKYTFFDPADTTFQQSTTVFYQIGGSGINQTADLVKMARVYPNPASDYIRLDLTDKLQNSCTASLLNIQGQLVASEILPAGSQIYSLPVSAVPEGLYFLRITDEKGAVITRKVSIKR